MERKSVTRINQRLAHGDYFFMVYSSWCHEYEIHQSFFQNLFGKNNAVYFLHPFCHTVSIRSQKRRVLHNSSSCSEDGDEYDEISPDSFRPIFIVTLTAL